MWINRHKLNNSLIVFVHGIFGDYCATWRGVPGLLQKECTNDPLIRSFDMFLFGYVSKIFRSPPIWPDAAQQLKLFLDMCFDKYQTVVIICHSQGGILAKLHILDMLTKAPDELKIDLIVTLGTPHRGRKLLIPLLWLQNIPVLGRLIPCRQLGQLASLSSNIRRLKEDWNRIVSEEGASLQSLAVVGAFDRLVSRKSASGFACEKVAHLPLDHPALAKPDSIVQPLTDLLLYELRRHHTPEEILTAIREIRGSRGARDDYVRRNSAAVMALVRQTGLGGWGADIKTASLLLDFIRDFDQRPLRKLTLDEAVLEYARRQLGNEM